MTKLADNYRTEGGVFTIELIRDGKNGPEVIQREQAHNLVYNIGKKSTWRKACGLATPMWDHMRIGSGSVAPTSGGSNLQTPVTGTLTTVANKTMSGRTLVLVVSYPSGAGSKSASIKEVVVVDQKTTPGGSALARSTFTAVSKTTSDKLKITYSFRIT